ncbi:MAG TPA: carboxypeptidase-like regulatory domain-containing protein [Terriglobales bacterium]|nr:carboxypeptidase-like regulatory domain-containing protein [Terriglobales bacterium]
MKLDSSLSRLSVLSLALGAALAMLVGSALGQTITGRLLGRVADPTGAVLAGVNVTLTNQATGVSQSRPTNTNGDYNFVEVVPGTYTVTFEAAGFKRNVQKDVIIDINQVVTLNSTLQIGQTQEVVEVTSEAPQVDTTSTQLGAVINDRAVNQLPLNTRDTYQFLQLQPGVQGQLGNGNGSLFYGSQDTGSVSVNGGRTRANNFSVNGGDANDQFVNLPTIQPTPDSVDEFRVITNTFDAEYGRNSGSVVNVITKSGTNSFHGNVYEYFRNTVLDSTGYFDTSKPQLNQNQFGGTFGGPIIKDRSFFFGSYEGRRVRQGIPGEVVNVPSAAQRTGDFSDVGGFAPPTPNNPGGGGINATYPFVAEVLNGRPGCTAAITALGGAAPAAGLSWHSIFPTGAIPSACQDPVAVSLMNQYIPQPNIGAYQNQSVPASTDNQDQFTVRFDQKITDRQNFTAYYYFNDISQIQPYDEFEQAGANIPGFGNTNDNRFQQWNLSHNWSISNALVNEARFVYMREGELGFLTPENTHAVTDSCTGAAVPYCFTGTSDSAAIRTAYGVNPKLGITPGLPEHLTGVPFMNIGGGAILGNNFEGFLPQVGNSFQWADNLTWLKGNHTFKFGVDIRRMRFDQYYYFDVSGEYTFNNSGPNAILPGDGDAYAEYLLGLTDTYTQGSGQREDVRGTMVYPFAQDSWKIKPNLTLNYGLRWELNTPPTDISGHVETYRAGQNSTVYPCALSPLSQTYFGVNSSSCSAVGVQPTGLVVPGDRGVPPGMTSTYYKAFAPRVGLAYSPNFDSGVMAKLFGNQGKTSIRAGWGLFYNPIEELVMAQFGAEPPFGGSSSLFETFLNTPFVYQLGGSAAPNPFNGILTPTKGQPVDYSLFRPILLYGEFQPHLRTQYTAQYNLTIQRQLARDLMLQVGYVGAQGHRLLGSYDINYSNPQTCVDIINIANKFPNNVTSYGSPFNCGPFLQDTQWSVTVPPGYQFHLPSGQVVTGTGQTLQMVGLRKYSSPGCNPFSGAGCPADGVPVFSDIFAENTVANSNYNAFEAMLEKRFSRGLQFQASYTYGWSIDNASTFEETLDPFNFARSRAASLFNARHRFVISYDWELPLPKHEGALGLLTNNWAVSGITEFQTGYPIRLDTENDNELIASIFFLGTEAPQRVAPFNTLNPKTNSGFYFNPNTFQDPLPLGTFNVGTQRSICCGPGTQDWDFAVHKQFSISEARYIQFRAEMFNIFNHTNFYNPDGHFSDGPTEFGRITQAQDPRLVQFALKFYF